MKVKYSQAVILVMELFSLWLGLSQIAQATTMQSRNDFSQTLNQNNDLLTNPKSLDLLTQNPAKQSNNLLKKQPTISNFTTLTAPVSGVAGSCPWTLDVDGTLTVGPGTLDYYRQYNDVEGGNYYIYGENWLEYANHINKVVLKQGVKLPTNCSYVFEYLYNCTEIDGLENLDTSHVTDMQSMFYYCPKLINLDVSHFNTSQVIDMHRMFYGCSDLPSLNLSSFDTSQVTDMSEMFYGCYDLANLDVSSFKTSQVKNMSMMFGTCYKLGISKLDLSSFDVSHVTDMSLMFYGTAGGNVLDVNLSGWHTSQLKNVSNMFYNVDLTDFDFKNLDTSNVTDMSYMFEHSKCTGPLDLSSFDTSNVISMYQMFYRSKISTACLSHFDTSKVNNMNQMFDSSEFQNLYLNNWDTSQVFDLSSMFNNCSQLTELNVGGKFGIFSSSHPVNTTYYYGLFSNCPKLDNLDLTTWRTKNMINMKSWFQGCSALQSVTWDKELFNTSKVTDMSNMFYGCSSLSSLDVSGFDTRNVTNMNTMFSGCSSLSSLDVSGFDTRQVTNMTGMFSGCSSLPSLDVSGFDTSNVTNMNAMFSGCSSLPSLNVSGFDTSNVTAVNYMFNSCRKLSTLDISNFNTTKVQYKEDAYNFIANDPALWKIKVSSKLMLAPTKCNSKWDVGRFQYDTDIQMPTAGATFQDGTYQYEVLGQAGQKTGAWQAVGAGSDHLPSGTVYATQDSLNTDFLSNASRPGIDQDPDASAGKQTQTLVLKHVLANQVPQMTLTKDSTTNLSTMDLDYCHNYQDSTFPTLTLNGSVSDNDSSQVQLYYAIDPVDTTPTLAEIQQNYQRLQLTPLTIQDSSLAQPWTADIDVQADLKTLATPKAGGHQIKIYAVDSGGQFTSENPQASTAATVNVAENSVVQLNYLDNNTNQPVFNTDEDGHKVAQTLVGVVGKPIVTTDQANFPTAIKTKHYRYTLTNAAEIPQVFPVITTDPLLPLTPYQLDLKYNSGTMSLSVPDTLDFGTKIVQTAKQAYDLPYDAARTALKVTDTTGAPSWQLSLAIADFTSDQTTTPLTNIFQYLPADSSTPTAISQTPALIDQYNKHHTFVDGSGKAVTDISTGWWDTSHHQIAGPKLDLRQLQVPVHKADYHATAKWALVNSLQ